MSLRDFLGAPVNTVTRERIFFNRLYYDLKMAAARREYALTIFEPEVDRDSYDIVLDDGDYERRFQLKTVLHDADTASWQVTKRFLRPDPVVGENQSLAPADCGFGGGIIIIEINANEPEPTVSYRFADYFVLLGLNMRLWFEPLRDTRGRGRPPLPRETFATRTLAALFQGSPREDISLERQLFLKLRSTDALLAMLGLHSTMNCYLPGNGVLEAQRAGFAANPQGQPLRTLDSVTTRLAEHHASNIYSLLDEPDLVPFQAPR